MKDDLRLFKFKKLSLVNFIFLSLILFLIFLAAHLIRVRYDPDPHHEGLILTAAIAFAEGLVPHRDYFSQYGPISSVVHGLWFIVAPNNLLSLRIFNAILLAITSYFLFYILNKKLSFKLSFFITLVWSISSPEILPAGLPWPSVISTLLLLIVIFLSYYFGKAEKYFIASSIGFLVGMSFFARQHNIVIPFIVICLSLIAKKNKFLIWYLFGYITSFISTLLLLTYSSALQPFFEQSILWPLLGHAGTTYGAKVLIVNALLTLQFPFFAIFLWFARNLLKKHHTLFTGCIALFLITSYLFSRKIPSIPVSERSFKNPYYLSAFVGQQFLQVMTFGLIGVSILVLIQRIRSSLNLTEAEIVVYSTSVGALFQLYPSVDSYHVWWIAPLLLATLAFDSRNTIDKFIQPSLLVVFLLVNLVHNIEVSSIERDVYKSSNFLGMYGNNYLVDDALVAIEGLIPRRSAQYDCIDGIYAANSRGYLANHNLYVNWPNHVQDLEYQEAYFRVVCSPTQQNLRSSDILVWSNDVIAIYKSK